MEISGKGATRRDESDQSEKETSVLARPTTLRCKKGLKVWYTNADGFINKRSELSLLLNNVNEKPHIIAINVKN